jgi:hypothetical protein
VKLAALPPLWGAALTVSACYAAGSLLIRKLNIALRRAEHFPLAFVLGAAILHLAIFALFALQIATTPVLFTLAAGTILAAAVVRYRHRRPSEPQPAFHWLENPAAIGYAIIFAIFTTLYFIHAWAPEVSADGSSYHLELISRYLAAHGFFPITTNLYSGFGEGAEMLYALAMAIGGHSAPALVHLLFGVVLVMAMFAFGLRIGKWWLGTAAALLVYLSPVVGVDTSSAYIDVALASVAFSVFFWLEIWDETPKSGPLIAAGLLAGYAFATKYPGGVFVAYAIIFVAWRSWKHRAHIVRPILIAGVCAGLMMAPWLLKNWFYLGDPMSPFGARIFRNLNMHISLMEDLLEYSRGYTFADKWQLATELTTWGDRVEGFLGPVFLALPLALLALRDRTGRRLLLASAFAVMPFFANIHARFLIPALPFFSMAMIVPLANFPRVAAALVAFHALASWPPVIRSYANPLVWKLGRTPLAAALRRESEDGFLRRTLPGYAEAALIEKHVPAGERVFLLSGIATSYTTREILIGYQGSLNQNLNDALTIGWDADSQPRVAIMFRFAERPIRRIRIVQTAQLPWHRQWGVQELRFFHQGREIQRSSQWRLHASPNPYEVQFAFDNSPVTRWRTWETASPGMYIETDFGQHQVLDEVRVETSTNDQHAPELSSMDDRAQWTKIADNPESREIPIRQSLRRAATFELLAKGVRYLLVKSSDYGASDYDEDPDSWGLELVAREPQTSIYRVNPKIR